MDILANCKIYPISNYINIPQYNEPTYDVGMVHIIIDEIKNKRYQWVHNKCSEGTVVIIDLLNVWMSSGDDNVIVVKDPRFMKFEYLIEILSNEDDKIFEQLKIPRGKIINGIIIDNLSIYAYEPGRLFNILIKLLQRIRRKWGCWVKTVSFGDDNLKLPGFYLNGMDSHEIS